MSHKSSVWIVSFFVVLAQVLASQHLHGNRIEDDDWLDDDNLPKLPSWSIPERSFLPWSMKLSAEELPKKNRLSADNRHSIKRNKAMTPEELASILLNLRNKGANDLSLDGLRFG